MIIYDSLLAKCLLNKKKHSFMIFWCCFNRYKYLEFWEEMENWVHVDTSGCISFPVLVGTDVMESFYFRLGSIKALRRYALLEEKKVFIWVTKYGRKRLPSSRWND